ncbi:ABC transporter permease [Pseudogemmobacter sp. CC-YST710]|uniref:Transport permease protein n=2 Tax=Pseudogemmobacter faecipullorum TaxID=2755041 RepID=A0ABS8CGG0_9RHOB|nr:ABC transporter permease [Pseudogemmobacter faecipullorum]
MNRPLSGLKPASFPALRSIGALMLREMVATYGRNPGGYVWAVLEPIGTIAIFALGFSLFIHKPPLGSDFLLFFATGFLPFSMYLSISTKVQLALRYSLPLLNYPRVVWIDAVIARLALAVITDLTVMFIVLSTLIWLGRDQMLLDFAPMLTGLGMIVIGATGIGLINGLLAGLVPIWPTLWNIINRPIFLASGVLFLFDSMPSVAQDFLWWNPLLQAISEFRSGFYSGYDPDFISLPYVFGVTMVLLTMGLLVMRKWHKIALER